MNIEQLQYIVEVARTSSLSAASENLHVTQSAISQAISNLEMELNIQLFTRSRLGTTPTTEGKKIIKKAMEIVIKLQEIKEEAQDQSEIQNRELRIVTIPVGMATLVKTVSSFKKEFTNTNIQVIEKRSKEIFKDIKENKVDLGLIAIKKNMLKIDNDLVFEPFWEGRIVAGVGMNSKFASKKSIHPEELLNYPLALYNEDYIHDFINDFTEKVGTVNKMFTSNNSSAVLIALMEGLAITLGYDFSFNSPLVSNAEVVMLEIKKFEQEPILFGWLRSANNKVSGISKQFINRFIREFQVGNL